MFTGPAAIRRIRPLLPAVAAGVLLTGCGGDPAPATPSKSPVTTSAAAAPSSSAPATTSPLTQDIQDAYQAAVDAHPGADLDNCTTGTSLDDKDCGAALRAAAKVAADTERRLRREDPEYADELYGAVFLTTSAVQGDLDRLRHPIPCYGLSDEPQPPPPLRAEAESICAEAADIFKIEYGIFLSTVEP
ncbi:hypothetical protein EJ357_42820 [Streptomyces cyaneochromogenes]|uniref:DUF732 domain-containing protein n=1 Tax=Streptomyces cyaneochromogenes TaxID=2496836 RepID=A0A3Q9EUW4_9ACTN|nr:hypothetical protein [Streptomyces cyaneochromogenes]AZQ39338.1 hypothetical protein EJ357_42820 [Streptomyces cyaneochromogenes]